MRQPSWVQACVKAGQRLSFTRTRYTAHNCLNLGLTATLLGVVTLVVCASKWVTTFGLGESHATSVAVTALYTGAATALGGWCYFGVFILVVHESSHGMFVLHHTPQTRRALNRLFGVLACVPFAVDFGTHWARGHLVHHRVPLEAEDPQRLNTQSGAAFWRLFWALMLVPGFAFVERFFTKRNRARGMGRGSPMTRFLVFWCVVGCVTWYFVSPLGLIVELGSLQVLSALNQLKGALEHGGTIGHDPNPLLRSRSTLLPLRWLLMPFNISLHFEHHLNATVPWYSLPMYHRTVRALVPETERTRYFSRSALASLR